MRAHLARSLAALAALAAAALAPACWSDDRPARFDRPRGLIGPIALKAQVAYIDPALDRVVLVDLAGDHPSVAHTAIGRRAMYAVPSDDRHHLFVITRGEQAVHPGDVDQPPMFWVVDAQHPGAAVSYPIGSPFDRIAVSPDGKLAITYYSSGGTDPDGVFRNPNELAIIDLGRPPDATNPALETIRSFGSVPEGITLSPPIVLPGSADPTPRSFAFILSASTLTVLDATHPDRHEVSIRLDLGGTPVVPRQVVFAPGSASAYVRSDRARDVLQVALEPQPPDPTDPGDNDFRAVVAELGAGGGPSDVAVYDDAGGRRVVLAATPDTHEVVVIDADTAQFRSIPIPDPINRVLVFPSADGPPHRALVATISATGAAGAGASAAGAGCAAAEASLASAGTATVFRSPRLIVTDFSHGFLPGALALTLCWPGSIGLAWPQSAPSTGAPSSITSIPSTAAARGTLSVSRGSDSSSFAPLAFASASRRLLPSLRAAAPRSMYSAHAVATLPCFSWHIASARSVADLGLSL